MRQRALIDIDLLLDTRYGTIKRIDEKIADTLVGSNVYRERHHDNFDQLTNGQIDRKVYQDLYARRDEETLFHSKMTDFVYHLRKDIIQAIGNLERKVTIDSIEVDINIWPYDLDKASSEMIRRAVAYYMPPPAVVGIVNMSPAALTPTYMNNSYELMAYYDHEVWLGPNQEALLENRIPLMTMLTPMIASSGIIPPSTSTIRDPFACRSAMLVKFLALTYIPTSQVCHNPLIEQEIAAQRAGYSSD